MRGEAAGIATLPRLAFGSRAPLWWGVVGVITIESVVFATLITSYFYLRLGHPSWPPPGIEDPEWLLSAASTALLLVSAWTMQMATRRAMRDQPPRIFLLASIGLATVAEGLRVFELMELPHLWNENSYTSIFWAINGLHFVHTLVAILGTGLIALISWNPPLRRLDKLAIQVDRMYWFFVVLVWIPVWVVLYLAPRWIG